VNNYSHSISDLISRSQDMPCIFSLYNSNISWHLTDFCPPSKVTTGVLRD
jgi:hypothetical protein